METPAQALQRARKAYNQHPTNTNLERYKQAVAFWQVSMERKHAG